MKCLAPQIWANMASHRDSLLKASPAASLMGGRRSGSDTASVYRLTRLPWRAWKYACLHQRAWEWLLGAAQPMIHPEAISPTPGQLSKHYFHSDCATLDLRLVYTKLRVDRGCRSLNLGWVSRVYYRVSREQRKAHRCRRHSLGIPGEPAACQFTDI